MNIEPDLEAAKSGALTWATANWRWLAAIAAAFALGLVL